MSSTLDRLIRVLSAFDAEHPALTVADLARRTELPLATAYRWVDRLVRRARAATVNTGRSASNAKRTRISRSNVPLAPARSRQEVARDLEEAVVGLLLADAHAHALARERPDGQGLGLGGLGERLRALAERHPHEVGLRGGQVPTGLGQGGGDALALVDDDLHALEDLSLIHI